MPVSSLPEPTAFDSLVPTGSSPRRFGYPEWSEPVVRSRKRTCAVNRRSVISGTVSIAEPEQDRQRGVDRSSIIDLLLLFAASWLPRMAVVNVFVTADERGWLLRTAAFLWSLRHADWQNTYLVAHPGVLVMWAGLPAYLLRFPEVAGWSSIPRDSAQLEAALWQTLSPLELLVAGRHGVILLVSLAAAAAYLPLRRLFDRPTAITAVLFASWSPFFLALSTLLHPDGLLAAWSILSVLLLSVWLYAARRARYLALSGITLGLALLAKSPAAGIAAWGALMMGLELVRTRDRNLRSLAALARSFALWIGVSIVVFVALWPVMWVDPVGALTRIAGQTQGYVTAGHSLPNFFLSRVVDDPGPLFYPTAYLLRASPLTLIGLVAVVCCSWRGHAPFDRASTRWTVAGLVLFAVLYGIVMSAGAKKFDRYILPAIVALDIVAAAGWVGAIRAVLHRRLRPAAPAQGDGPPHLRPLFAGAITIALLHGALNLPHFPYYGTYFNPLLGGGRTAPRVLLIGWGEGLDQAGRWLSEQGDAPFTVVSWYEDGPLSYFLPPDARTRSFIESDHYWFDADFLVLYQNQVQRKNPDADMINHFLAMPADLRIRHAGLDLAWVYDLRGSQPPPFTGIHTETAGPLVDNVELAAYRTEAEAFEPGDDAQITLFLRAHGPVERDLFAEAKLVDPAGDVVWQERRRPGGIPTAGWPPGEIREDAYTIPVAANAGPGTYSLYLRLVGASARESGIGSEAEGDALPGAPWRQVAGIVVQAPETQRVETSWGTLSVAGLSHASSVAAGESLLVDVTFDGRPEPNAKLSLRLTGDDGMAWAQVDKQVAPALRFELAVPADAPPNDYALDAVLYDGETLAPYPDQDGKPTSTLSTVRVE